MKDYLQITKIIEAKNEKITSEELFSQLIKDFKQLLNDSREIKKQADSIEDYETSAMIDEYILNYGKKIWMISQMLG